MLADAPLPSPPPGDAPAAPASAPAPPLRESFFMILDTREAEGITERAAAARPSVGPAAAAPPKLSARELASGVDKGLHRAHAIGERAYTRAAGLAAPAVDAARRVGRLPSLAGWPGFGGRRAPADEAAANPGGGGGGGDWGGGGEDPAASATAAPAPLPPVRPQAPHGTRVVYVNDEANYSHFGSNYISNTKYTLWSALPMFLIEHFSRFSNAHFLVCRRPERRASRSCRAPTRTS